MSARVQGCVIATRPIIDGWQRLKKFPEGSEGERIAPRGYVMMTVPFSWLPAWRQVSK